MDLCSPSENDRIWFFGGMQYNTTLGQGYTGTDDSQDAVSFSTYWFLDDANGYFNQTFNINSNAQFPAGRYWHSLTLLPGKGQVLMYGGYFAGKPSTDIAYLFDTNTLAWSVPNISNLKPRFGHSAIAVGQDTVYFLFGVDGNLNLLNSVDILNTTSWTFLDADVTNSLQNSNGGGGSTGSTGITTGAIAGIVVGVVVGLGAIIGAAFVCIRKRRNREIPEAPAMFHEMGRQSEFPAQPQPPAFPTQPQPPAFPAQTHQSSFPDNSTVSSTVTPNSVQMGSIKPTDNSTFVSSPSTQYFAPVKPTEYHHEPDHTTLIKPYADH
ncbi:hypothetical protein BC940DRAFT_126772 [Gongronella butleri]|nr:hypothetical protein BC940DRAFT_126772 [Gongronella butleri]